MKGIVASIITMNAIPNYQALFLVRNGKTNVQTQIAQTWNFIVFSILLP